MSRAAIGQRVFALRNAKDGVAYLFGYGTYDGYHQPPGFPVENPRITLEGGKGVVWGYQCWWGTMEAFDTKFRNHKREMVPLPE